MEYKTLTLTDNETGKIYEICPTSIAQVLGKLRRTVEYINRNEKEIALNFIKNAVNAADEIIRQKTDDENYRKLVWNKV